MGLQIGFGIVNVIDPITSSQVSLIGQFKFMLAVLVFLAIGGHRYFIGAMGVSFQLIPPGEVGQIHLLGAHFVPLFGQMLVVGVKLAAPILAALLLSSFAEGIVARTVPQMNIFIVGFGIRIAFGIFMLTLSISFFVAVMRNQFDMNPQQIYQLLRLLAG